jgi:hypothetical protein
MEGEGGQSIDYELSDRVDWYHSLEANYDMPTLKDAKNILQQNLKSTYIFCIENAHSMNPEIRHQVIDDGNSIAHRNWALLASVSYRRE